MYACMFGGMGGCMHVFIYVCMHNNYAYVCMNACDNDCMFRPLPIFMYVCIDLYALCMHLSTHAFIHILYVVMSSWLNRPF